MEGWEWRGEGGEVRSSNHLATRSGVGKARPAGRKWDARGCLLNSSLVESLKPVQPLGEVGTACSNRLETERLRNQAAA